MIVKGYTHVRVTSSSTVIPSGESITKYPGGMSPVERKYVDHSMVIGCQRAVHVITPPSQERFSGTRPHTSLFTKSGTPFDASPVDVTEKSHSPFAFGGSRNV